MFESKDQLTYNSISLLLQGFMQDFIQNSFQIIVKMVPIAKISQLNFCIGVMEAWVRSFVHFSLFIHLNV